jgi:hypothetical protein
MEDNEGRKASRKERKGHGMEEWLCKIWQVFRQKTLFINPISTFRKKNCILVIAGDRKKGFRIL